MTGETRGRSRAGARDQKLLVSGLIGRLAVTSFEFRNPTAGIEDFLLTGVERVTLRADIGVNTAVLRGAAGDEGTATGASHRGFRVCRMNIGFHGELLLLAPGRLPARNERDREPQRGYYYIPGQPARNPALSGSWPPTC